MHHRLPPDSTRQALTNKLPPFRPSCDAKNVGLLSHGLQGKSRGLRLAYPLLQALMVPSGPHSLPAPGSAARRKQASDAQANMTLAVSNLLVNRTGAAGTGVHASD